MKHNKHLQKDRTSKPKKFSKGKEFDRGYSQFPRQLPVDPHINITRRYTCSAGTTGNVKISDLLNSHIFAATTTVGYAIAKVVRLKRMKIWGPVTTQGTTVFVQLRPVTNDSSINSYIDQQQAITDQSISIDLPAFVDYKPKKYHPSGSWHQSSTVDTGLVNITIPAGGVMDLEIEYIANLDNALLGYTTTLVAATVGTQYVRPILTNLIPASANSI